MSSKTGPLVLVTGISGFFAQFVVDSLLASPEQYRVRGTLRSLAKRDAVLARLPERERARVEFVEVKATESSDLSEALRGVDLVAHTASPYQLDVHDVEAELLRPALEGTLNVLRYAKQQPSVKRIAITSSFAAVTDFNKGGPNRPGFTYTERDWNPEGWEDAVKFGGAGARAYSASKKIADKAAWDFVEQEKPHFVVSTFNPPMIYGPPIQPGIKDVSSLNTSAMAIYRLISRLDSLPDDRLPLFCHARDVADAHVQWLAYPREPVPLHRYLLCGGAFYWKMACEHISQTRPELADRLPKGWKDAQDKDPETALSKLDTTPAQQELGIKFRDWKTTLDETLDGLLALEKGWK